MFLDASRVTSGKRARPWSPSTPSTVTRGADRTLTPHIVAPTTSSSTTVAPFLSLLDGVSTGELLKWLATSVAASSTHTNTNSRNTEPCGASSCSHARSLLDPIFDAQLASSLSCRPRDAMLTRTCAKLSEAEAALGPAEACLFELLVDTALGPLPQSSASSSQQQQQQQGGRIAQNTAVAHTTGVVSVTHTAATLDCEKTDGDTAPKDATRADVGAQKGILKRSMPVVSNRNESDYTAAHAQLSSPSVPSTSPVCDDSTLSLTAKLLYVILETSAVGATRALADQDERDLTQTDRRVGADADAATVSALDLSQDWGIAEKKERLELLVRDQNSSSTVVAVRDVRCGTARWGCQRGHGAGLCTPSPRAASAASSSAPAGLSSSLLPCLMRCTAQSVWPPLTTTADATAARTSAPQATLFSLALPADHARLWLSPTTITLMESSRAVASRLRWSTTPDLVLAATMAKHTTRSRLGGVAHDLREATAELGWDATPEQLTPAWQSGRGRARPWKWSPLSSSPSAGRVLGDVEDDAGEGEEEEAVRRLFVVKPYTSSGNRSPLTNRERRSSAKVSPTPLADLAAGPELTVPPAFGAQLLYDESSATHHDPSGALSHSNSLLASSQYTEEECAMLFIAIHYCCVGVPDPYLLTWLVRGDGGGGADGSGAEEQEGSRIDTSEGRHSATASRANQRPTTVHAGLKRAHAEASTSTPPRSPWLALHPQFLDAATHGQSSVALTTPQPSSALSSSAIEAHAKRAKAEGVAPSISPSSSPQGKTDPQLPPLSPRLCRRNVAAMLAECCELGTLFVRLEQLCAVAVQPGKRGALGSYGKCAVDGLRAALRLCQRHATLMMTATTTGTTTAAISRGQPCAQGSLHRLCFDRVLDGFFRLQEAIGVPLRTLASLFGVDVSSAWNVTEAVTVLSSAEMLSRLYVHLADQEEAAHSRLVGVVSHGDDALSDEETEDRDEDEANDAADDVDPQAARHRRRRRLEMGALQDVVGYLFCCTVSPLNRFLQRWLTQGDCRDPLDEFFIVPSYGATPSGYEVDSSPQRLPCFISEDTAHVVLQAGLSMRVLRLAATHVLQSAGFVLRTLMNQSSLDNEAVIMAVGGGADGVEEAAAAREDAGVLHDAVAAFLSAVTGRGVPHSARSREDHVAGLPAMDAITSHGAVAHWRLFFASCDDALVTRLQGGLLHVEADSDKDDELGSDAVHGSSAVVSSSLPLSVGAPHSAGPTALFPLTQDTLRRQVRQQGGGGRDVAATSTHHPASHITIPMVSEVSGAVGGEPGVRLGTTDISSSASSAMAGWSGAGDSRRRHSRARSFMSYESALSRSSSALSSGATSALYGAIQIEHRLGVNVGAEPPQHALGDGIGTSGDFAASRRALQQAYADSLRAHQRAVRLAEWKAERQALWVDRVRAVRDAIADVQDMYSAQDAERHDGDNDHSKPANEEEDVEEEEEDTHLQGERAAVAAIQPSNEETSATESQPTPKHISSFVRPCAVLPPPQRKVEVLYPAFPSRLAASTGVSFAVTWKDSDDGPHSALQTRESPKLASRATQKETLERRLTKEDVNEEGEEDVKDGDTAAAANVSPPPRCRQERTLVEIAVSPVATSLSPACDAQGETTASETDKQTAGPPLMAERTPPRGADASVNDSWVSPLAPHAALHTPARLPTMPSHAGTAFASPGITRDAVGGRDVAAELASLWADHELDLATPPSDGRDASDRGEAGPLSERFDSVGLPQPSAYFVIADINDDEFVEQRAVDGLQQQQRRREKMAMMTRAREGMARYCAEATNAQLEASALADLPAYREACQRAVARLDASAAKRSKDTEADDEGENENGVGEEQEEGGESVETLLAAIPNDEGFRRTWWRDAPGQEANPDRHIWDATQYAPSSTTRARSARGQYFYNPLTHNTTQKLLSDAPRTGPLEAVVARQQQIAAHDDARFAAPQGDTAPSVTLRLSREQRRLLLQCPSYYRQVAQLAARYSTHKALQLSLLPPHGLQFQWLASCLDVCLLQHAPTAVAMTTWWETQVRARLDGTSGQRVAAQDATNHTHTEETLLNGLNSVFGEAWERLRIVPGTASATISLPTAPTRVTWRRTGTSCATTNECTRSFLPSSPQRADTSDVPQALADSVETPQSPSTAAVDELLLFLSDIRLEHDVPPHTHDDTAAASASPSTRGPEVSLLRPDANLLADYGALFSTLLFWKLVDQLLLGLYQDGLASQEKAVFLLSSTARALLRTLQEHFWERLQVVATHYRAHSLDVFSVEALYDFDTLESFQRQHHGFVSECLFAAMLARHFKDCRAQLLALVQALIAAHSAVHTATRRVQEASTAPGKKEQRRRVRDVVSQHLRHLVTTASALVDAIQSVQAACSTRAMPVRAVGKTAAASGAKRDDDDEDEEIAFGHSWYNATDSATAQGDTERDRQHAWRSRAQHLTRLLATLTSVVDSAMNSW